MKKFFSKFKKGGKKTVKGLKKLERKPFEITKLGEIDDFFSKLQAPMDTLCDLSDAVSSVNETIMALTEAQELVAANVEKTVKSVMRFMRIEAKKSGNDFTLVVTTEGYITVEPKSEPEGIVAKVFSALKQLVEAIKTVIEKAPGLKDEIQGAVEASKDLPNKAKSAATSAGLNPLETAKAVKATASNVKYLGGFPNDVIGFIENVKELVQTLKDTFEGDPEGGAEGGKEEKKE